LDVRAVRKPGKHPQIFEQFNALAVGESFVLMNNHDPWHLRDEFETDHPGEFSWRYLQRGPERWEIRITRLAPTPLPRILCDAYETATGQLAPDASGAIWSLQMSRRHPDANVIRLQSGSRIEAHAGAELDVLLHILHGDGLLMTEVSMPALRPGGLLWLPRLSPARSRGRRAGSDLPHRPLTTVRIDHPAVAAAGIAPPDVLAALAELPAPPCAAARAGGGELDMGRGGQVRRGAEELVRGGYGVCCLLVLFGPVASLSGVAFSLGVKRREGGTVATTGEVRVRRVYDEPDDNDGVRVLVDRIWPRGMTKARAALDEWCKDVAPSTELRKWFSHDPAKFEEFTRRYVVELEQADRGQALQHLRNLAADRRLTLLTATKDVDISEAAVLAAILNR
jgi:uncharacterized protein YeaO (DUF488 family)/uncharacterized protein (DUF2249 family)